MSTPKQEKHSHFILRLLQGALIGSGGILPGISGGVLCVVFGLYRPIMEAIAHPFRMLRSHWMLFLPVGIGGLLGFLGGSKAITILFRSSEVLATWLFIGLILGTIPSLWKQAGEQGRTRGSYISSVVGFVFLFGLLLYVQLGASFTVAPSFGWFVFCGVLWGLSIVVPGMSSSSILMSMGLFVPLTDGIASLSLSVCLPWVLGTGATVLLLARVVNYLFDHCYSLAFHAVFGVTIASTLIIVPLHYQGTGEILGSLLMLAVGTLVSHRLAKLDGGTAE